MIYVFLANGFEEIEALAPVDFLRRAGVETLTVGVGGKLCRGAHGVTVEADISETEVKLDENLLGIILPGGMPGAENLDNSEIVGGAIDYCAQNGKLLCAICAAPFILGKRGLLKNKNATCFPGFEGYLDGARVSGDGVVADGNIITAKGAGVAWEFAAAVTDKVTLKNTSAEILRGIQWKK